ncbi:hypothetical protein J3R30DRAFT_3679153 [Lentinula aciculospora]|uniref:Uncharacterized protein n=1 Tax=Lentinula aciculospora TaxID=153920 RepID=A0A9W9AUS7_9AGAR|nr:hypothetical protein J3R30DRAFT_3679153 [Lentinula aciculospora]
MDASRQASIITLFQQNALSMSPLDWSAFNKFRTRSDTSNTNSKMMEQKIRAVVLIGRALNRNKCVFDTALREVLLDNAVPERNGDTFLNALGDKTVGITDDHTLVFFSHLLKNIPEESNEFNQIQLVSTAETDTSTIPKSANPKRLSIDTEESDLRETKRSKSFGITRGKELWKRKHPPSNEEAHIKSYDPSIQARRPIGQSSVASAPLPSSLRRVPVRGTSAAVPRPIARPVTQSNTSRAVSGVHRQAVYLDHATNIPGSRTSAPSAFPSSDSWVEDDLDHLLETRSEPFESSGLETPSPNLGISDNDIRPASSTSSNHAEPGSDVSETLPAPTRTSAFSTSLPSSLLRATHALLNTAIPPSVLLCPTIIKPTLLDDTTVQLLSVAYSAIGALLAAHEAAAATRGESAGQA